MKGQNFDTSDQYPFRLLDGSEGASVISRPRSRIVGTAVVLCLFFFLTSWYFVVSSATSSTIINTPDQARTVDEQRFRTMFDDFMVKFNRNYKNEEKARRYEIFVQNVMSMEEHNNSDSTWKAGINQFSDMTHEEFQAMLGYRGDKDNSDPVVDTQRRILKEVAAPIPRAPMVWDESAVIPEHVDWTTTPCVTPVKNQGNCGSCWAFSASGAVESAYCLKHNKTVNLSEQQLVDCASAEGNKGCNGGGMDAAFLYMMAEKGLCSESAYPYHAKRRHCHADACTALVDVVSYIDVPHDNEKALMFAVAYHGPVSVAVHAEDWKMYHSGVYDQPCGKKLDHGVLVVGYGTENGTNYWIIKNSWSPIWGEHGYIRLTRNSTKHYGECGILIQASFPIVA